MVPYLWRADLNSVTGSGSGAKCSNILPDITVVSYGRKLYATFLTGVQREARLETSLRLPRCSCSGRPVPQRQRHQVQIFKKLFCSSVRVGQNKLVFVRGKLV
jgi:hypothetical protein